MDGRLVVSWREVTSEEQAGHAKNGFGGWLTPIFIVMLGLSIIFLVLMEFVPATLTWAVDAYGEDMGKQYVERFSIWSIVAVAAWSLLLLLALLKNRLFPMLTLVFMWPLLIWSNALNIPLMGVRQTISGFFVWAIIPVLITLYLLFSERVNVTYRKRSRS